MDSLRDAWHHCDKPLGNVGNFRAKDFVANFHDEVLFLSAGNVMAYQLCLMLGWVGGGAADKSLLRLLLFGWLAFSVFAFCLVLCPFFGIVTTIQDCVAGPYAAGWLGSLKRQ